MKIKDMRTKSDKELANLISTTKEQIAATHVSLRTSREPNVKQLAGLKQTLARALTLRREREIKTELGSQQ